MKHFLIILVACLFQGDSVTLAQESKTLDSREFEFFYNATIKDVPRGSVVRVWIPVAENNAQQVVELLRTKSPKPLKFNRDDDYGNRIGYMEIESAGAPVELSFEYRVKRRETAIVNHLPPISQQEKELLLQANSLIPLAGRPQELLENLQIPERPLAVGKTLYDVVQRHMKYDKSKPGYGNGDAIWACDSRTGNCTDFHSLFISLARSRALPAKFEIGFPIGPQADKVNPAGPKGLLDAEGESHKVEGYHCWAWFYAEGEGWAPVDISEADKHPELEEYYFGHLTEDRVTFSTGRDIQLVPESNAGRLNYFIYPHVEIDGKVWKKDNIELKFSYRDMPNDGATGSGRLE